MKIRQATKIATLIAGLVTAVRAEAITQPGALGVSLIALDVYAFTCPAGTAQVSVSITDGLAISNSALVSVTFAEDGNPILTSTNNERVAPKLVTNTVDGAGIYALAVRKTASGREDYSVQALCLDRLRRVIGPSRLTLQINE